MNPYLFLAIGIIAGLLVLFLVLYFMNKKTPVPKGCENLRIGQEACGACQNTECGLKTKIDLKKVQEEIEEDKNDINN